MRARNKNKFLVFNSLSNLLSIMKQSADVIDKINDHQIQVYDKLNNSVKVNEEIYTRKLELVKKLRKH